MRAADGDARRDEDVDEDVVAALALEFGGGDGAGGDLNAHEWSKDEWRLDPGMFDVLETGTRGGTVAKTVRFRENHLFLQWGDPWENSLF